MKIKFNISHLITFFFLAEIVLSQGFKISGSQITSSQNKSSSGNYSINSGISNQSNSNTVSDSLSMLNGTIGITKYYYSLPPEIKAVLADTIQKAGFPINIRATLTDLNGIASADVYLQVGGSKEPVIISMTALNDSIYETSIADSLITVKNFKASVLGKDKMSNIGESSIFTPAIKYVNNELSTEIENSVYPKGVPSQKWRMISFPGILNDPVLHNAKNNNHVFYKWNGKDSIWIIPDSIVTGQAYWFKHLYEDAVPFVSDSGFLLPLESYEIRLNRGWNMVGNPFSFSAKVQADPYEVSALYFFGDSLNRDGWILSDYEMMPWAGYSVFSYFDSASIFVLPFETEIESRSSNRKNNDEWYIKLSAESEKYIDESVIIGCKNISTMYDREMHTPLLPSIEKGITVALSINDEGQFKYSSHFRTIEESNSIWDLHVLSKNSENIEFSINDDGSLPNGFSVALLDIQKRKAHKELLLSSIKIESQEDLGYELKLIVGTPEFVRQKIKEILLSIPSEFTLSKNYPNPFNPITNLDFSIPKKSQITMRIYNMLGQEVITLLNEEKSYGNYSISWNGLDNKGVSVASGVYFAELRSKDKRRITKMLFLK